MRSRLPSLVIYRLIQFYLHIFSMKTGNISGLPKILIVYCSQLDWELVNMLVNTATYTAVWSKWMWLMGKFNIIPNCVAILPVLSSGYKILANVEMHLGVTPSNKNLDIFQARQISSYHSLRRVSQVSQKSKNYSHFRSCLASFLVFF